MKKKRGKCIKCGAKKYTKFLREIVRRTSGGGSNWICLNEKKCEKRSANYRK